MKVSQVSTRVCVFLFVSCLLQFCYFHPFLFNPSLSCRFICVSAVTSVVVVVVDAVFVYHCLTIAHRDFSQCVCVNSPS